MSTKKMSEFEDVNLKIPKPGPELKSYHDGANEERSCILAKIRRMMKKDPTSFPVRLFELWLLDRDKRYRKKAGGL